MKLFALILLLSNGVFAAPGVVVLAGGEAEGDIGVKTDWSYSLYKKLVDNGDTTGDKKIKVVVLSLDEPSSNFMVDYFKSMGADSSHNLVVSSKEAANDPSVTKMMEDADVVFIRGGNQGRAYQLWKGSKVQAELEKLSSRGGAVGGTSSGAMGLSQYSITGGQDFDAREVLSDSHSPLLNDEKNIMQSGIHNDFLNMAPGVLVDTHCGERGRVGRLMATMAKAVEDYKDNKIVAICLEERTGIAIENGKAKIYGTGGVHFLSETAQTKKERIPGKPLSYVNVRNDVLTDGWTYSFDLRSPDIKSAPEGTKEISPVIDCASVTQGLRLKSTETPKISFTAPQFTKGITVSESAYSDARLINGDVKKGIMQTYAFDKIAKNPSESIIMLDSTSELKGLSNNEVTISGQTSSLVLDCKDCTHTSKSPYVAFLDSGLKTLHSSALVNMRIHVIGSGDTYNVKSHDVKLANDQNCPSLQLVPDLNLFIKNEEEIIKNLKCPK